MVGPLVLITLGVLFLLNNLYPGFEFSRMWPVILIVIGFVKIADYFQGSGEGRKHRQGHRSFSPPASPPAPPPARPAPPLHRPPPSAAPAAPRQSAGYSRGTAESSTPGEPGSGTSPSDPGKEGTP